ncbi:MAG: dTMP kinase [Methanomassiliicoccales archaeon]|jgi:dTMP kinase|nr:dTMP kinase [Methanomassiliicoccales archaeon]MDD1756057.1 dTMP kinase [Methanomassiliicoccales archaeon]
MSASAKLGGSSSSSLDEPKPEKGVFIVFEGVDGSGKSTVAKMVFDILSAEMPGRVVLTAEPTESFIGKAVRHANESGADELAEALLFVADRAEHTRQIRAWLAEGKVVLSDRYYASTIAYQGALLKDRLGGAKRAVEWLKAMNEPVIIHPDLTLLLTVSVKTAVERLKSRKDLTKFEDFRFLNDVDLIYRGLCMEDPSFHTLDASKPAQKVVQEAFLAIRSKL